MNARVYPRKRASSIFARRDGKVLIFVGLMLTVLLGMAALAVDLGVVMVTRAQLQAASDSGSLAAGTELTSGLGAGKFRTPAQVKAAGETQAVNYVALHPAGEAASTHIDPARDIRFGRARLDVNSGVWTFTWDETPYNAVEVSTLRSAEGSQPGDRPLPMYFARALGTNTVDVNTDSVAVIMPAGGIQIQPGGANAGVSPFAFSRRTWLKYWRARKYFEDNELTANDLSQQSNGHLIPDPNPDPADVDVDGNPHPLFYERLKNGNQYTYRQLFDDRFKVNDPELQTSQNILNDADGVLEMNIFPLSNEAGNFGTVNIGTSSNSTQVLSEQILNGLTGDQLANYTNDTLEPSLEQPLYLTGDTGISAGIQAAVEQIVGQKRAILLYDEVKGPGNNAQYTVVEMIGVRIMNVSLTGRNKTLTIQPDTVSHSSFVPNYNGEITEQTTFFSPLILAR